MNRLKDHPRLVAGLIFGAVVLGAEIWGLQQARQQAERGLAGLEQKKQDRDRLARQSPALSEANEQAIAQELARADKMLAALRETLRTREPQVAGKVPVDPIEAYFEIADFVERMRAQASRAQVTIRPEECFGFEAHANQGPAQELVPAVSRQVRLARFLTEALIEARPRALLAVQRERPRPAGAGRGQGNPPGPAVAGDFWATEEADSLRITGRLESETFRFDFSGQTPALRAFLNSVAAMPLPVIVRRVEVAPLAAETGIAPPPAEGAAGPLVEQSFSRFSVVLEWVELLPAGAAP